MMTFALLIVLVVLFSLNSRSSKKKSERYCILIFSILGFLMMGKSADIGNDTYMYRTLFFNIASVEDLRSYTSRYETGYVYYNRLLSKIWLDPQIVFIVTGAIVAFSFGRFIYRYSNNPRLSALMFLTLQFFDMAMSGMRQILAISILLYAVDYVIEKKPIRFCLIVLFASSFHTSVILFLIIYPLSNIECSPRFLAFGVLIGIVSSFVFDRMIQLVAVLFPAYEKYFTGSGTSFSSEPKTATTMMLLLWLVLFVISYALEHQRGAFQKTPSRQVRIAGSSARIENIEAISIFLSIVMLLWSLQGTILVRFKYVFSFLLLTYYPNALSRTDKKTNTILEIGSSIVFIAYILVIYIYRPEWQSTYPYAFFWLD